MKNYVKAVVLKASQYNAAVPTRISKIDHISPIFLFPLAPC